ncbi:MAG: PQ-loop domain-containing transporter [Candidatus Doudnabacteria bacterium]
MSLVFRNILKTKGEGKPPLPAPGWIKKLFLDDMAYVIGVLSAVFNIPQLVEIWVNKNATGVSSLSWTGFSLVSVFWLYYSIVHKEKALILTFSLTLILQAAIALGSFIY